MRITEKWITEKEPCEEAIEWWDKKERDPIKILKKLIKEKKYDWANWFIVRVMDYKGYVSYAIYAAEQVIDLFEKQYPEDKRPRQAIEAAKKCIKNPSEENNSAVRAASAADSAAYAASAADSAAYAARAADSVAYSAASAADSAAYAARAADSAARAADSAAYAARAAYSVAYSVAYSAAYSAADSAASAAYRAAYSAASAAACNKMKLKILRYGMKLLRVINERD